MGKPATAALVGVGGIGKTIAQNHRTARQRRANHLSQVLGPRGEHQQQFGIHAHGFIAGCQQQFTDTFGQRRTARFAGEYDVQPTGAQTLGQVFAIGALARAFRPFQGNE
ncbi:hypothetical protein ABMD26_003452 [Pseudomonas sp. PvP001]